MDPSTQAQLDHSAHTMADGLKLMNPEAVKILQLEAYLLGVKDEQGRIFARYDSIIDDQAKLIERLTAKLKQLEGDAQ